MARELAAAERAAVYGRIGTCTQEFGTLASWLVDVLNVLTGNLDREGGAMFTEAAAGQTQLQRRARTRPRLPPRALGRAGFAGLPEAFGELPVACLAEEIETPGRGPDPGDADDGRQPGALDARLRAPRPRPGLARLHGLPRRLRQRDHPPRRRHPPRALLASPASLRRRPLPAGDPQRRQLLARRCCRRTRRCPTSGATSCGSPGSSPARGRRPTSTRSTTSSPRRR